MFLIRHGETDAARSGEYAGQRDDPLNETGRGQAARLAARFARMPWRTVHASTMRRARETARELAAACGAQVREHDALKEMDYGRWVGLPAVEIARTWPREYAQWKTRDPDLVVPGGESIAQVRSRVEGCVRDLLREGDEDLVVVAHGGSLKVATAFLFGWDIRIWGQILQDCTGVTCVMLRDGQAMLRCFNDTAHLETEGRWWRD